MPTPNRRLAALLEARRAIVAASASRRRARRPAPGRPPAGLALEYSRELSRFVDELHALALEHLEPHLEEIAAGSQLARGDSDDWLPPLDETVRLDSPVSKLIGQVIGDIAVAYGQRFPESRVSQMALRIGRKVEEWNRREVNKQFRAVLSVDLPAPGEALALQLEDFRAQNVNLITRMMREQLDRIQGMLERRARQGSRVEEIRRELMETQGIGRSRAQLIARDQVLKFNGELTQLRHREAGVDRYEWSTSGDERVRETHRALNGTIHRWDNPPIVDPKRGRREHPGGDYQCRCVAIPIIELPED